MKKFATVTLYSIAMGYVEAALVVYLREMIFGNAQQLFPLRFMDPRLAVIETVREFATLVMLATVAALAGKNRFDRIMYFIYAFAIWDLFYYVALKVAVGWPASFLTFDVLFLIPVIWVGPVLAPMLIAALLAIVSAILVRVHERVPDLAIKGSNIAIFVAGCVIDLYSFTAPIFHILFTSGPKGLESYTPKSFDWVIFGIGYLIMCAAVFRTITDSFHKMKSVNSRTAGEGPDEVI